MNNFFLQIYLDEIDDDGEVMLIWDFEIIDLFLIVLYCLVKVKILLFVLLIDFVMFVLDLSWVICNCVNFSLNIFGKVLLVLLCIELRIIFEINIQKFFLLDVDEENVCEDEEEDMEEEEGEDDDDFVNVSGLSSKELFVFESIECLLIEVFYIEIFILKGSLFYEYFQRILKSCKDKMINKEIILIRFGKELVNRRDENVILVYVCFGDIWELIGYIFGVKVFKVMKVIDNNEIIIMLFFLVKY